MSVVALLLLSVTLPVWDTAGGKMVESYRRWPPVIVHSAVHTGTGSDTREMALRSSSRGRRSPYSACEFPSELADSSLDCVIYPSKVMCVHTCVFGHTLRGGISKKLNCELSENRWSPDSPSETCKPFVDCGVTVGPGGQFRCHKNFMERGPYCEISCSHYEDKDPVPKALYQCDIKGKWTPDLPFCVTKGSGIMLAPEPPGPRLVKDV